MRIGEFLRENKLSIGDNLSLLLQVLGINNDELVKNLETNIGETAKMSKSKGNVVDPEEAVARWGADTVRLYILFAAPPEQDFEWTEEGIQGAYRFLNRLWSFVTEREDTLKSGFSAPFKSGKPGRKAKELRRVIHFCLRDYLRDIEERGQLNTAIAHAMKLLNALLDFHPTSVEDRAILREGTEVLLKMLFPFTPHICEELWQRIGGKGFLTSSTMPSVDEEALIADSFKIPVQVNGKLRTRVIIPAGASEEDVREIVLSDPIVIKHMGGRSVKRFIYVKDKLVNVVTE